MEIQWVANESIKPTTPGNSLAPKWKWIDNSKIAVEFTGSFLKEDKATFTHRNVVSLVCVTLWS